MEFEEALRIIEQQIINEPCKCKICLDKKKACEVIIDYLKGQQKEIEELKEEQSKRSWVHIKENGEVEPLFYISKDKIREKIKEIKDWDKELFGTKINPKSAYAISVLQKLLEEEDD